MKKKVVSILALFFAIAVDAVVAGHLELKPTGFAAYKQSADRPITGGAVKFDLSQIPDSCRIDLAELSIKVNSDTALGRSFDFFVNVATSQWPSSPLASTTRPVSPDSLLIGTFTTSGNGVPVEVNVTKLVRLWYSGKLTNNGFVISIPGDGKKGFAMATKGADAEVSLSVFFSKR